MTSVVQCPSCNKNVIARCPLLKQKICPICEADDQVIPLSCGHCCCKKHIDPDSYDDITREIHEKDYQDYFTLKETCPTCRIRIIGNPEPALTNITELCPICFNPDVSVVALYCGHHMCLDCWKGWQKAHVTNGPLTRVLSFFQQVGLVIFGECMEFAVDMFNAYFIPLVSS